jgi:hypothetical protein
MKSGRSFFFISLLLLISPTLLSTQVLSMKIVGKKRNIEEELKRASERENEREREREQKGRNKNQQQTTNNIILTSRAIFRALMASLRGEMQKRVESMFSKEKQHREVFGVRKPQTEQYLKGLNEGS